VAIKDSRLIKARQKAVRMVYHLKFGWSVVTEYDADELADDSDDEQKIEGCRKEGFYAEELTWQAIRHCPSG